MGSALVGVNVMVLVNWQVPRERPVEVDSGPCSVFQEW